MNNRLEIQIGNKKLVAEINDWSADAPSEIYVFLEDENCLVSQDICMVRECFSFNPKQKNFEINSEFVDCFVWGESDNEDYTDKFCIGVRENEDD